MRRALAAAILSAAISGVLPCVPGLPAARAADEPANAAASQPAAARVPVKEVVLFSSGVGYFEHFGTVEGDGSTELRFKTEQVNDILKSLVLQDMDGGKVTTVSYPSLDPVAKTLRSFQVDITANPPLAELLNQLRGAAVSITLTGGTEKLTGTVLGVEHQQRPVGEKDKPQLMDVPVLNLITGGDNPSIRSVELPQVRDVSIQDPALRRELAAALAALSQARDKDKKPVTVHFSGKGERRVRIGYVVETPVWKTSYRLILSGDPQRPGGQPERGKPHDSEPDDNALDLSKKVKHAGGNMPGDGMLQGWAIVENQTDNDWDNIQLSLVSGRPISFIQDLYQPLYVPRPIVQPELYASLRPQTYDAGMDLLENPDKAQVMNGAGGGAPALLRAPMAQRSGRVAGEARGSSAAFGLETLGAKREQETVALDAATSVSSVASASKVGELFQYTVGSVSLPRQKSAMLPIVTDPVEVERLSIYNQAVLPKNPLFGARVKNTTGKHLLQGPITVLEGGSYAGDARIDDVPPGQERLISYGIDQQVLVNAANNRQTSSLQTARLVKGVLELQYKQIFSQEYVAENKSDHEKTLMVEHPLRQGWKLAEPKEAAETTEQLYRFKIKLPATNKPQSLTVREEVVQGQAIEILPMDAGAVEQYVRTGEIPKSVKDALAKAAQKKYALVDTQRLVQDRQQKLAEITAEQNRIRENLKTVSQSSDYYQRLLKKLNDQETSVEKLQDEIRQLQEKQRAQQKDLEDYVLGMNVA